MQHGVFYIVAGALFALYAVDLIFRISVSLWAKSRESRKLGVPYSAKVQADAAKKHNTDNKKRRGGIKAASQGSSLTTSSSAATLESCSNGSSSPPGRQNSQEPASKEGSESPTVSVELSAFDSGDASKHLPKQQAPVAQTDGDGLTKFLEGVDLSQGIPMRDDEWPLPISKYPSVLVQVPMYNEEAHCGIVVERMCAMAWPRSRLLIQILDDSTREDIRARVDAAAARMVEDGHPVVVVRRTNRQGYKAGAMSDGLKGVAHLGYKYVAIFDADFKPPADFLLEMVAPLEARPDLAFTQAKWLNPYHNFLTWVQHVELSFFYEVEQRTRATLGHFVNFNGTAGVWRIKAIDDAGGWHSDTVVEDMDLSLRSFLAGYKGHLMPHVGVDHENPDDMPTYRTQQYRWFCGPMQILTKAFTEIYKAKNVPLSLRIDCYSFFFRYLLFAGLVAVVLLVPPMVLWIQPWQWQWPEIFFMVSVNMGLVLYLYQTLLTVPFMLFCMSFGYFRIFAMLGGLFGSKKSKSWKVTKKKGAPVEGARVSLWQRAKDAVANIGWPYALEFALFVYYAAITALCFAGVGLETPVWTIGSYTALTALVFLCTAFGDIVF